MHREKGGLPGKGITTDFTFSFGCPGEKASKGADDDKKLVWHTINGFNVKPHYRNENREDLSYLKSSPGEKPYTRGHQGGGNVWEVREDIQSSSSCPVSDTQ